MATSKPATKAARQNAATTPALRGAPRSSPRPSAPVHAYVLHHYDWSEASLIVELFTREQGRVVVAAKGAKRPTSQLRPVLLPFQPLLALLGRTPTGEDQEIHVLRSAEWDGAALAGRPLLPPRQLFAGYYLNELLIKLLLRQDAQPLLFDAYADTLAALASGDDDAPPLRAFELLLLRQQGWLPALDAVTLSGAPLADEGRYTLHGEAGLMAAPATEPAPSGVLWRALESVLAAPLLDAADVARSAEGLRLLAAQDGPGLRAALRRLLDDHLGHRPLRTRQVRHSVARLTPASTLVAPTPSAHPA